MAKLKPVTPGELLLEEFLLPMGLSQYRLGSGPAPRPVPRSDRAGPGRTGPARAKMTPEERAESARKAAAAR